MILTINGTPQTFIPLKAFRAEHTLPESFTIAAFEPKDDPATLASIEHAADLDRVRTFTLDTIPPIVIKHSLLSATVQIVDGFRQGLYTVNDAVRLKEMEIDFAVNGLDDMLRAWAFEAMLADSAPDFDAAYGRWLNNSVRLAGNVYIVETPTQSFACRIVFTVYGRVGLQVTYGDQVAYVADRVHVCPAEGFMASLCREIIAGLAGKVFTLPPSAR